MADHAQANDAAQIRTLAQQGLSKQRLRGTGPVARRCGGCWHSRRSAARRFLVCADLTTCEVNPMMPLEHQVCSHEPARRLAELACAAGECVLVGRREVDTPVVALPRAAARWDRRLHRG